MKSRLLVSAALFFSVMLSAQHFNTSSGAQAQRRMDHTLTVLAMQQHNMASNMDELEKEETKKIILQNELEELNQQLNATENPKQKEKIQKKIDKVNARLEVVNKKVNALNAAIEADKKAIEEKKSKTPK